MQMTHKSESQRKEQNGLQTRRTEVRNQRAVRNAWKVRRGVGNQQGEVITVTELQDALDGQADISDGSTAWNRRRDLEILFYSKNSQKRILTKSEGESRDEEENGKIGREGH